MQNPGSSPVVIRLHCCMENAKCADVAYVVQYAVLVLNSFALTHTWFTACASEKNIQQIPQAMYGIHACHRSPQPSGCRIWLLHVDLIVTHFSALKLLWYERICHPILGLQGGVKDFINFSGGGGGRQRLRVRKNCQPPPLFLDDEIAWPPPHQGEKNSIPLLSKHTFILMNNKI